jgi:TonB family protein
MTNIFRSVAPLAPALLAAQTILAHTAAAQPGPRQTWTVRGDVRTTDGIGILGADLWVTGAASAGDSSLAGSTDERGSFRFVLPLGDSATLVVRRRGFRETRVPLVTAGASKHTVTVAPVTLAPLDTPLVSVVVPDTGKFGGRLAPFYRHLTARGGDFITRADIARMAASRTSILLRTMRGVNLMTGAGGAMTVQLSGHRCPAAIFLDGAPLGARSFDFDMLAPDALAGIEVFSMSSTLPLEYQTGDGVPCGAIGIWTRGGAADVGLDAASITDERSVRLASGVDSPARLAPGAAFAPDYPSDARAIGMGGPVLVEFVVDTTGAVERRSWGVVAASVPELADAVLRAVSRLRFEPARVAGRPVRQLVMLAARFQASGRVPRPR